ncbi:MAG TPA: alpha/beta hydrolase-fold protein [Verrucomicrobiae bacterium]|jgi:enterochelin esterase family protein
MKALLLSLPLAFAFAAPVFSQSPVVVQPSGRVTFNFRAPNAKEVKVNVESLPGITMQKNDDGVWSATTDALEPDYYGYSYSVDGVHVIDSGNPLMKYNLLNTESEIHVPGPAASTPWDVADVPRGVIHQHNYKSAACNDERTYYVYTPPRYDASSRKKYPALYLLHGFSDDARAWWSVGQANVILDNLIARGEVKPMIVIMPLGYGTLEILHRQRGQQRDPGLGERNSRQFKESLLNEVLPQAEKEYRISSNRKDRALAGLSMGGAESLTVGLNSLDKFAWIGAFSSGGVGTNYAKTFPNLDTKANDQLKLLWVACGKDDGLFKPNKQFVDWLDTEGIRHTWTETPGVHSWRVWRRNLAAFTPLLFR